MKKVQSLLGNPKFILLLILIAAALLRFYKLADYTQFLGDQGRDVLVVKRIIVDHKWTLLGPTMSVAGFYVGPIYYYFMIPFLWVFNLNPVGPVVMAALFGIATIFVFYVFVRRLFSIKVALLGSLLMAFSPKFVQISRFSWNPNPMPFFTLLIFSFLHQYLTTLKARYLFLAGVFFGILIQLHYLGLVMGPVSLVVLLIFRKWKGLRDILIYGLGSLFSLVFFILYEFRHQFQNTKGITEFVFRGGKTVSLANNNLVLQFNDLYRQLFEIILGFRGMVIAVFCLAALAVLVVRLSDQFREKKLFKSRGLVYVFVWLGVGLVGLGAYTGQLFEHYYGYLFPLPLILTALFSVWARKNRWTKFGVGLILVFILASQIQNLYFWRGPNREIRQSEQIADIVLDLTNGQPYNFALISKGNSDESYRYFLETKNRPPVVIQNPDVDPGRTSVTPQLLVICEQKCGPLGYSLWEIAGFGRAEIASQEVGPAGITVYKLVHYFPVNELPAGS